MVNLGPLIGHYVAEFHPERACLHCVHCGLELPKIKALLFQHLFIEDRTEVPSVGCWKIPIEKKLEIKAEFDRDFLDGLTDV